MEFRKKLKQFLLRIGINTGYAIMVFTATVALPGLPLLAEAQTHSCKTGGDLTTYYRDFKAINGHTFALARNADTRSASSSRVASYGGRLAKIDSADTHGQLYRGYYVGYAFSNTTSASSGWRGLTGSLTGNYTLPQMTEARQKLENNYVWLGAEDADQSQTFCKEDAEGKTPNGCLPLPGRFQWTSGVGVKVRTAAAAGTVCPASNGVTCLAGACPTTTTDVPVGVPAAGMVQAGHGIECEAAGTDAEKAYETTYYPMRDPLQYAAWAPGQPDNYCTIYDQAQNPNHSCYGEYSVAMGNTGFWFDLGDHVNSQTPATDPVPTKLYGLVEWNSLLDCVAVTESQAPGSATYIDPFKPDAGAVSDGKLARSVCVIGSSVPTVEEIDQQGADTADSGALSIPSIAACVDATLAAPGSGTAGQRCPVGTQSCTDNCAGYGPNFSWNWLRKRCEATVSNYDCDLPGYSYNSTTNRCEKVPGVCAAGSVYDSATSSCKPFVNYAATAQMSCPSGGILQPDGITCAVMNVTLADQTKACLDGQGTLNADQSACIVTETTPPNPACTSTNFDAATGNCSTSSTTTTQVPAIASYSCSVGSLDASGTNCTQSPTMANASYTCPSGGTVSGSTCVTTSTYAATGSGGTNYSVPLYLHPDSVLSTNSEYCSVWGSGWAGGDDPTIVPICNAYAQAPVYGYIATTTSAVQTRTTIFRSSSGDGKIYGSGLCQDYGICANTAPYLWMYLNTGDKPVYWTPNFADTWMVATLGASTGAMTASNLRGYVSSQQGVLGGTYTCPSGGTLSGTTCTKSSSYAGTATYTCPSGSTLSGTSCVYPTTPATVTYSCADGSPAVNGMCTTTNSSSGAVPACTVGGYENGQCVSRTSYPTTTQYSCPAGTVVDTTQCSVTTTYAATVRYVCSNGGVVSGSTCVAPTAASDICPAGFTPDASIGQCAKSAIQTSVQQTRWVSRGNWTNILTSDPGGDRLRFIFGTSGGQVSLVEECGWGNSGNCGCARPHWGGSCVTGTIISKDYSADGSLTVNADAYVQSGATSTSKLNTRLTMPMSNFYSCETGTTLNGDKCVVPINCGGGVWDNSAMACTAPPKANCGSNIYDAMNVLCYNTVSWACPTLGGGSSSPCFTFDDKIFYVKDTVDPTQPIGGCDPIKDTTCKEGTACSVTWCKKDGVPCEIPTAASKVGEGTVCVANVRYLRDYYSMANIAVQQQPPVCTPNPCASELGTAATEINTEPAPAGTDDVKADGTVTDSGCSGKWWVFNGADTRCIKSDTRGMINSISKIVVTAILMVCGVGAIMMAYMMAAMTVVQDASVGNLGMGTVISAAVSIAAAYAPQLGTALSDAVSSVSSAVSSAASSAASSISSALPTAISEGFSTAGSYLAEGYNYVATNVSDAYTYVSDAVSENLDSVFGTPAAGTGSAASFDAAAAGPQQQAFADTGSGSTFEGFTDLVKTSASTAANSVPPRTLVDMAEAAAPAIASGMMSSYGPTKCCYPDKISGACFQYDKNTMEKWSKLSKGACHRVGEYCSLKWPITMPPICVQKKQTNCCFNSLMARIIVEQGRQQMAKFLKPETTCTPTATCMERAINKVEGSADFGKVDYGKFNSCVSACIDWGGPKSPKCQGFTLDEFQMIDFSQIEMQEFIDQISAYMNDTYAAGAEDTIQKKYPQSVVTPAAN